MTMTEKATPWPSDVELRKAANHLNPGQILALWRPEMGILREPVRMWRLNKKQAREFFAQAGGSAPRAR